MTHLKDGNGIAISLGVLAAPNFQYVTLGRPLTQAGIVVLSELSNIPWFQVVLARNVSFPTLAVLWSESGFPAYYFDEARQLRDFQICAFPACRSPR